MVAVGDLVLGGGCPAIEPVVGRGELEFAVDTGQEGIKGAENGEGFEETKNRMPMLMPRLISR